MKPHVIRVAQVGWNGSEAAKSVAESSAGTMVPWVEIDGHRLSSDVIVSVEWVMDASFTVPKLTLIGRVEIIYTDKDGKPLPLRRRIRAKRTAKKAAKRKAPVQRSASGKIVRRK